MPKDFDQLLNYVISTAADAGDLALKLQAEGLDVTHKAGGSPVSNADLAVNAVLQDRLTTIEPSFAWLSEESADKDDRQNNPFVWVVDPIDGTRAFLREDDPNWCIGIALLEHGIPVLSVIHAPAHGETYSAIKGAGGFLNGERLVSGDADEITGCRMIGTAAMFSHPAWPEPWPDMTLADPKPNATLYRMALIARGAFDGTIALVNKSDWDLAPGALIVEEAGGLATTHIGETFQFNREIPAQRSLLCSGKQLHPLLIDRVKNVRLGDPNEPVA